MHKLHVSYKIYKPTSPRQSYKFPDNYYNYKAWDNQLPWSPRYQNFGWLPIIGLSTSRGSPSDNPNFTFYYLDLV